MQGRAFTAMPSRHAMSDHFPPPPQTVAERMADMIVACLEETGHCRIIDLRSRGFTLDELARYWPEACRLAEIKRPRPVWRA